MNSSPLWRLNPHRRAWLLVAMVALLFALPASATTPESLPMSAASVGEQPLADRPAPPDMPPPPYLNLQIDLVTDDDAAYLGALSQPIESRGWTAAFYPTPGFAAAHPLKRSGTSWRRDHELGCCWTMT